MVLGRSLDLKELFAFKNDDKRHMFLCMKRYIFQEKNFVSCVIHLWIKILIYNIIFLSL